MRSDHRANTREPQMLSALVLVALGVAGCIQEGVVLERGNVDGAVTDQGAQDGATDQPLMDGDVLDTDVPDTNVAPDDGVDAGPAGNVTIRLTGFNAYAGMTIRARLGALSGTVVSAVIQADGTAIIVLNQIFTILNSTYFESYVDVDGSGSCNPVSDHLAAANVILDRNGDDYEVDLDESDTNSGLLGCLVLN
ncbi:MAG: hypothetical protein IPL19_28300 [Sandaracinaceae bacterium]|nr:hypothetical protein [Sandaracinaceae bacterium]